MNYSDEYEDLIKAKAAAEKDMEPIIKDSVNSFCRNRYASLGAVLNVVKPALARHNIAISQTPEVDNVPPGIFRLRTELVHLEGGQWLYFLTDIPVTKNDAQGVASAYTYARRYALMGLFNLVSEEDDDGNNACGNVQNQKQGNGQEHKPNRSLLFQQIIRIRDQVYGGNSQELLRSVSNFLRRQVPTVDNLANDEMDRFIKACSKR